MKHRWIWGVVCCLLLTAMVGRAEASSVLMTDVRYWLAPEHIQIDLAFNVPVTPSYHHRSNPARFVLEIPNCEYLWGNQTITVNDVLLQRIRVQRLNNNTAQVVFDLANQIETYVQILPSANGQPDRVIVTLAEAAAQTPPPVPAVSSPEIPAQVAVPSQNPPAERQKLADPFQKVVMPRRFTVVLDPGHGGQDSGAVGPNGTQEKNVVLEIARMMKTLIEHNAPSIEVYLTRDDDFFLSLRKRTEIAEEYNADLFISLHVNANPSRKVNGFSVYTLSENATDAAARELAEKENAVDLMFGGVETPVPNDALLTFVLADLSKTAWLQHSLEFSQTAVETTVAALSPYKIAKEGIKRANFAVLRTAAMPAVLVEACYISNEKEEGLLARKDFQTKIAQSLSKSAIEYFAHRQAGNPQTVRAQKKSEGVVLLASAASQPIDQPKVHVVKSGESLSVIAGKYRVDLTQLCQVNNLARADMIYIGQRLWIP